MTTNNNEIITMFDNCYLGRRVAIIEYDAEIAFNAIANFVKEIPSDSKVVFTDVGVVQVFIESDSFDPVTSDRQVPLIRV